MIDNRRARLELWALVAIAILQVLIWQLPYGRWITYPFSILSTWFHEMGHGLAALVTGGSFKKLVLLPDGSGYAETIVSGSFLRLKRGFVAAAGPFGPALAGYFILRLSSSRAPRSFLFALSSCLGLSLLLWVRSLPGLMVLAPLSLVFALVAIYSSDFFSGFMLKFVGVQACISAYKDFGYFFTRTADVTGLGGNSDTGALQELFFLPYWFWGALITAGCALLLYEGILHSLESAAGRKPR